MTVQLDPKQRSPLEADRIMEAVPGDLIRHPDGMLVKLVACYPDRGYWFWHPADAGAHGEDADLCGGQWPVGQQPEAGTEMALLGDIQRRREELIEEIQRINTEMALLGNMSGFLYRSIIRRGKDSV
mgnify:FL=1